MSQRGQSHRFCDAPAWSALTSVAPGKRNWWQESYGADINRAICVGCHIVMAMPPLGSGPSKGE